MKGANIDVFFNNSNIYG